MSLVISTSIFFIAFLRISNNARRVINLRWFRGRLSLVLLLRVKLLEIKRLIGVSLYSWV